MKNDNFNVWMDSIDDNYLEEAAKVSPPKKKYNQYVLIAAACLVLATVGLLLRHGLLSTQNPNDGISREYFTNVDSEYTLLSCEATVPTDISGIESDVEPLIWTVKGLEIKLCSTNDTAWASWFDANANKQWCLISDTTSLALLTTAAGIIEKLGYNIAVAPESATDITYNAFLLDNLTVVETTFLLEDIRYSYRMSATYEVSEDFADISGLAADYANVYSTSVGWCSATLSYTENTSGKIIWFDVVPGLLYSLSMETNASEEALLSMAHELFEPAQDTKDW